MYYSIYRTWPSCCDMRPACEVTHVSVRTGTNKHKHSHRTCSQTRANAHTHTHKRQHTYTIRDAVLSCVRDWVHVMRGRFAGHSHTLTRHWSIGNSSLTCVCAYVYAYAYVCMHVCVLCWICVCRNWTHILWVPDMRPGAYATCNIHPSHVPKSNL